MCFGQHGIIGAAGQHGATEGQHGLITGQQGAAGAGQHGCAHGAAGQQDEHELHDEHELQGAAQPHIPE